MQIIWHSLLTDFYDQICDLMPFPYLHSLQITWLPETVIVSAKSQIIRQVPIEASHFPSPHFFDCPNLYFKNFQDLRQKNM